MITNEQLKRFLELNITRSLLTDKESDEWARLLLSLSITELTTELL
jgi:hypothetical protein